MKMDIALLIEANTGIPFGRLKIDEAKKIPEPVRPVAYPRTEEARGSRCDRWGHLCSDCTRTREPKERSVTTFSKQLVR